MSWQNMCFSKKEGGMGFRHISEFNISMLGKQAWRLLVNTSSLTTRLLRARYFPSTSFREASLGNNPSFVWRSIMAAKELVYSRSILKVGDGEMIKVWTDPWIPAGEDFKVSSPVVPGLEEARV